MKKIIVGIALSFLLFPLNAQIKPVEQSAEPVISSTIDSWIQIDFLSPKELPDYKSIHPAPQILRNGTPIELKDYRETVRIDSLWVSELTNSDLFPQMQKAIYELPDREEDYTILKELPTDTLKKRLAHLDSQTPFDVAYNSSVEKMIHFYLGRNKNTMERLMSLSQFYFPLFEKELDKYNLPLELKVLPVIESALNPKAKSRMGATGLWQFMYATGKMQGLAVSSYVDERMDPVKSTEAACRYLSKLYKLFGDWNLVLASYNAGPGNVARAIRRSGGKTDYWKIRKYLPRETANYVPAYMAALYVFSYADAHNFKPYRPEEFLFETDTLHVKDLLKFDQIEKVTGIDQDLLEFLNPEYKLDIIPFVEGKDYYLRLPIRETGVFVANEDKIYNYTSKQLEDQTLPRYYLMKDKVRYRVKRGDYLGRIANRYGVSVSQIKRWNRIRGNTIRVGQSLVIHPKKPVPVASTRRSLRNKDQKTASKTKHIDEKRMYVVQRGDTLWGISRKIGNISVSQIQKWNDISGRHLKPGMKLNVSGS